MEITILTLLDMYRSPMAVGTLSNSNVEVKTTNPNALECFETASSTNECVELIGMLLGAVKLLCQSCL